MDFIYALKEFEEEPITRQLVLDLLREYKRPNDKINELVKQDVLTSIKRGLYMPGPNSHLKQPDPFLIANHLWGPSYISLESALSYWGMIPERVYEISSITLKPTKIFKTAIGRFNYLHAKAPYYTFGIQSIALSAKQMVMIASPEKALIDKIIMTSGIVIRSTSQARDLLIEDYRMEETLLKKLNLAMMKSWIVDSPKRSSLAILIKMIDQL